MSCETVSRLFWTLSIARLNELGRRRLQRAGHDASRIPCKTHRAAAGGREGLSPGAPRQRHPMTRESRRAGTHLQQRQNKPTRATRPPIPAHQLPAKKADIRFELVGLVVTSSAGPSKEATYEAWVARAIVAALVCGFDANSITTDRTRSMILRPDLIPSPYKTS